MRERAGLVVLGLAILVVGRGLMASDEKRPTWLTDVGAARDAARLSGKPIFAVIH